MVDPAQVPKKTLANGDTIPAIGLGTFGSDNYSAKEIAQAVYEAAQVGYRHFDCAEVYGNEQQIGDSLAKLQREGMNREGLWVTSKVWNDHHGDVRSACENSLKSLQLDYLNCYLVHWPFPNFHPPGCDVDERNPDAKPYIHDGYMNTWRQMEALQKDGLARHIGTSNMTIPKLRLLLRDCNIRPSINQLELHPHFQQPELFNYLVSEHILPVGFSPIGSPSRPERDRTNEDTVDTEDPVILKIADRLNVHPAIVCIKWAVQNGQAAVPFSVKRHQFEASLDAVCAEPLTQEDMQAIANIDKNCRLIKGQVFLWKQNQPWRDLWDEDGKIAQ
ncbi:MAG: aldo/keto reductase [Armatimonadetes bacterium]|nr:aldo/keto reductase [Armatimonadota bacterium]